MAAKARTAMAEVDGKRKVSPKAIAAAVIPAVTALVVVLVWWIVTGELNRPELAIAITGVLTSILTGLGAWLVQPGETIVIPADIRQRGRSMSVPQRPYRLPGAPGDLGRSP